MASEDEPVLGPERRNVGPAEHDEPALRDRIERLTQTQPYGVLCTHDEDQAYGSLVAVAFFDDLRRFVFSTPVATRKYRLLREKEGVSLVMDDRPAQQSDMMQVEAITVTGRARELDPGPDFDRCAALLVERHPQLRGFVAAASSALFAVEVVRYLHVARFQEVSQWLPGRS